MAIVPTKPLLSRTRQASWLEELRRWCRRNTVLDSPDIRAHHSSSGVSLLINGGETGAVTAQKLILADASQDDYLVCRPWDALYWACRRQLRQELGEAPTTDQIATRMAFTRAGFTLADLTTYLAKSVIVAKPPELRVGDFDGFELDVEDKTYLFDYPTATTRSKIDLDDEDNPESQVIVPRWVPEFSVIHAARSTTEMTVAGQPVKLVDLNLGGRAWSRATS